MNLVSYNFCYGELNSLSSTASADDVVSHPYKSDSSSAHEDADDMDIKYLFSFVFTHRYDAVAKTCDTRFKQITNIRHNIRAL